MSWDYSQLMTLFSKGSAGQLLLAGNWGLEKESLRITPTGDIALTPHPQPFGNKIDNPYITVDFSESQLELITPPLGTLEETHRFLTDLHLFVEDTIENELLWPLSMPGPLPGDEHIPLARYGQSQSGREKEIYRAGLALRYGKKMQMISGIHYNFSFTNGFWNFLYDRLASGEDRRLFADRFYLNLVKNFLKYRWLLIYLLGASPLGTEEYMNTFLKKHACRSEKAGCRITFKDPVKHATSLRMSRFGYENTYQNQLNVSYNALNAYISDLQAALATKVDAYAKLGVYRDGQQVQLNDNLLQSENEYYAPVRFKQITKRGETMLQALKERGIAYLEFRIFDLNPFEKTGIGLDHLYFIHVFLLYCAFEKCNDLSKTDHDRFNDNAQLTALYGRNDRLRLTNDDGQKITIQQWGKQLFKKLMSIAQLLDQQEETTTFQKSVEEQFRKLGAIDRLPSATIANTLNGNEEAYQDFGLGRANKNREMHRMGRTKPSRTVNKSVTQRRTAC